MSIWLQAAKESLCQTDGTDTTDRSPGDRPDVRKKAASGEVSSVLSVRQFDRVALDTASGSRNEKTFVHGTSPGGRPLTWTGRVVSLDAWRNLSEWERHGPQGALWSGASRKWEGGGTD